MREIKFRAWHVKQKKMYSSNTLGDDQMTLSVDGRGFVNVSGYSTDRSVFYGSTMVPMQYTGLKDKNGKEIYEGDILDKKYRWDVLFTNGCFLARQSGRTPESLHSLKHRRRRAGIPLEIIGNIYENPELLEKSNGARGFNWRRS